MNRSVLNVSKNVKVIYEDNLLAMKSGFEIASSAG